MLPSVNLSSGGSLGLSRNIIALKPCTLSLSENGANETPRYHEMVGTGLPEEKQAMLTESPSCTVTVPFRFMVIGAPVDMTGTNLWLHNYIYTALYQNVLYIDEFRYYGAKIEESEKAGSHRKSNPGHLWLEPTQCSATEP